VQGSDSEEGLGGLGDGSHAEPESDAGDAQEGFSNSSDDGLEAAAGLVGQVRSDLGVEDSGQATRTDEEASEDKKKPDEQPPLKSPSSGAPHGPKRSSIFASVGKSIAALGMRRGSVTGRRNSALAARRASRVERRMSKLHLPDEDAADIASTSMPVGKFRSIRRMSRPLGSVFFGDGFSGGRVA